MSDRIALLLQWVSVVAMFASGFLLGMALMQEVGR